MELRIGSRIADGGYADVWNGVDELGRHVAVKLIRASAAVVSDAITHARALVLAAHPNVVAVFSIESVIDPDTGAEVKGIVMELLKGETLEKRLRRKAFTRSELVHVAEGIIAGIAHIHEIGLAHGDLHEGNVMIDEAGDVKLIDILWTGSFAALSTTSKEKRMAADCRNLRMLLYDMLINSELDAEKISAFGSRLTLTPSLEDIRAAFIEASSDTQMPEAQLDFYYGRFDEESFVSGSAYAQALSEETPDAVIVPLLLRAIELRRMTEERLDYVHALWERISDKQRTKLLVTLSNALSEEIPKGRWTPLLRLLKGFGAAQWKKLNRLTRLRAEGAIANDIINGRVDYYEGSKIKGGALGTWANLFGIYFEDISPVIEALRSLLSNNWYTQNYVGQYFMFALSPLSRTEDQRSILLSGLQSAILNGAFLIKQNLHSLPREWRQSLGIDD